MRVMVAGATGVIGRLLVPELVAAGHEVIATTRTPTKTALLRSAGAEPVLLDGMDAVATGEAVAKAEPEAIIHEMTAIPAAISLRRFDASFAATNALRRAGTDNLLAAASAAGVRRFIAQGYAASYARTGGAVKTEADPLDPQPPAAQRETVAALMYMERAVREAPLEGIVLRYGPLYGPGASDWMVALIRKRQFPVIGSGAGVWSFLHVADAATATAAALTRAQPGIYNVADDDPVPAAQWLPEVARLVGGPPPRHVPGWLGRLAAGGAGLSAMTRQRGASNAKAREELGWAPAYPSWRDGFARGL